MWLVPSSRNSAAPIPTNPIWFNIGLKDAETRQKFNDNLLLWMAFGSLPLWLFPLNTRFSLSPYLLLYHLLNVLITGTTSFKITRLWLYLNRKIQHKPPSDSQLYGSSVIAWYICRMTFWMQWRSSGCKEPSAFRYSSLYWSSISSAPALQCSRSLAVSASLRRYSTPGSGSCHCSPERLERKAFSWQHPVTSPCTAFLGFQHCHPYFAPVRMLPPL